MRPRTQIWLGAALGVVWALVLVFGMQAAGLRYLAAPVALPGAWLGPALSVALLLGVLGLRRAVGRQGADLMMAPGSRGDTDLRVLNDTAAQAVLALLLWPLVAMVQGGALALALGGSFLAARLVFWIGAHVSPFLRALGSAATAFPTILAALWAGFVWFF